MVILENGRLEIPFATIINKFSSPFSSSGKMGMGMIAIINPNKMIGPIKKLTNMLESKKVKDNWLKW